MICETSNVNEGVHNSVGGVSGRRSLHRFSSIQSGRTQLLAHDRRHCLPKFTQLDRFAHDDIYTLGLLVGVFHQIAKTGKHNNRLCGGYLFNSGCHTVTVHLWHCPIGHHQVKTPLFELLQAFASVGCSFDSMSVDEGINFATLN